MNRVRVSMVWLCAALIWGPGASAQTRFVAQGAEVTDMVTGLVWRRCSEGQRWSGTDCSGTAATFTWQGALARARAAVGDGVPWRLPDVKELASLVDDRRVSPAIDTAIFPNTPSAYFWSSTHFAGFDDYSWIVLFVEGTVTGNRRSNRYAVRLVRGGG